MKGEPAIFAIPIMEPKGYYNLEESKMRKKALDALENGVDANYNAATFIGDTVIAACEEDSDIRRESIESRKELREAYIARQRITRSKYWDSGWRAGMLVGVVSCATGAFVGAIINSKKK